MSTSANRQDPASLHQGNVWVGVAFMELASFLQKVQACPTEKETLAHTNLLKESKSLHNYAEKNETMEQTCKRENCCAEHLFSQQYLLGVRCVFFATPMSS